MLMLTLFFTLLTLSRGRRWSWRQNPCSIVTLQSNLGSSKVILREDVSYISIKNDAFAGTLGTNDEIELNLSPDAIILADSQDDVSKALKFAKKCNVAVSVRSGGHSYAGLSSCEDSNDRCIQVVMSKFKKLDKFYKSNGELEKVTIGAGWRLKDAQEALLDDNAVLVAGICHGVGVGGHFSTSASSWLSKTLGSGLNYVESFKIVLSGGRVIVASREKYKDLYFAVIGGAPGSLGIVLEYTIKVVLNNDIPNAYGLIMGWLYSKKTFYDIWKLYLEINADEEFINNRDVQIGLFTVPNINSDNSISTTVGLSFFWAGLDNGNYYLGNWYNKYSYRIKNELPNAIFIDESNSTITELNQKITRQSAVVKGNWKHYSTGHFSDRPLPLSYIDNITNIIDDILSTNNIYISINPAPGGSMWGKNIRKNGGGFPWINWSQHIDTWILWKNDIYAKEALNYLNKLQNVNIKFWNNQGQKRIGIRTFIAPYGDFNMENVWDAYYPNRRFYEKLKYIKYKYDNKNIFRGKLRIPLPPSNKGECHIGNLINQLKLNNVIIRVDPDYQEHKNNIGTNNLLNDTEIEKNVYPDAIIYAKSVKDVHTTLNYAKLCNYQVKFSSIDENLILTIYSQ